MSYRVKTEVFEGPFDLLLHLVTRHQVDIGAISITEIADQYLAEVERMTEMDLDVASDFLVVAATLLQIKAASLLPQEEESQDLDDEFADLSPEETREVLIQRLVTYKQFKNAAAALGVRMENEGRMHPRHAGIEKEFVDLMPDFLQGMTLRGLAVICADLASRRDTFLLEAEHIASVPVSMERHMEGIYRTLKNRKEGSFNELIGEQPTAELVVVTFLAVLELYKRGVVFMSQSENFGDIQINYDEDAPEITDFSVPDWGDHSEDEQEETIEKPEGE